MAKTHTHIDTFLALVTIPINVYLKCKHVSEWKSANLQPRTQTDTFVQPAKFVKVWCWAHKLPAFIAPLVASVPFRQIDPFAWKCNIFRGTIQIGKTDSLSRNFCHVPQSCVHSLHLPLARVNLRLSVDFRAIWVFIILIEKRLRYHLNCEHFYFWKFMSLEILGILILLLQIFFSRRRRDINFEIYL